MGYDDTGLSYDEYVAQEKKEALQDEQQHKWDMIYFFVFAVIFGGSYFFFGYFDWYFIPLPVIIANWVYRKKIKKHN